MIAIDTNVLLRYLLWDDKQQAMKADALVNGSAAVLVTDVVLAETIWTLKGKRYGLDRSAIVKVIHSLFEETNILFEDGQTVWRALHDYRHAKPIKVRGKKKEADFPDALIVHKAKFCSSKEGEDLEGVYTFDSAAREIPGTITP